MLKRGWKIFLKFPLLPFHTAACRRITFFHGCSAKQRQSGLLWGSCRDPDSQAWGCGGSSRSISTSQGQEYTGLDLLPTQSGTLLPQCSVPDVTEVLKKKSLRVIFLFKQVIPWKSNQLGCSQLFKCPVFLLRCFKFLSTTKHLLFSTCIQH